MSINQIDLSQATDLSARFLKVRIATRMPRTSKGDKESALVAECALGAQAGSTIKASRMIWDMTLPKWVAVTKGKNAVTAKHNALTSVYDGSNWRLLPTHKWLDYGNEINPLITVVTTAVYELSLDLPDMIQARKDAMGAGFIAELYPQSPEEFRAQFGIEPLHETIPSLDEAKAKTRNLCLPIAELEKMEQSMERAYADNIARINAQNFERLHDVATALRSSLEAYSRGEQRTVKTTLLDSIEKACSYCSEFNLNGDAHLSGLVEDMRNSLTKYSMEEIREDAGKLAEISTAATIAADKAARRKAQMSNMAGYMN